MDLRENESLDFYVPAISLKLFHFTILPLHLFFHYISKIHRDIGSCSRASGPPTSAATIAPIYTNPIYYPH